MVPTSGGGAVPLACTAPLPVIWLMLLLHVCLLPLSRSFSQNTTFSAFFIYRRLSLWFNTFCFLLDRRFCLSLSLIHDRVRRRVVRSAVKFWFTGRSVDRCLLHKKKKSCKATLHMYCWYSVAAAEEEEIEEQGAQVLDGGAALFESLWARYVNKSRTERVRGNISRQFSAAAACLLRLLLLFDSNTCD